MIIHITNTQNKSLLEVAESFYLAQKEIAEGKVLPPPERQRNINPIIEKAFKNGKKYIRISRGI